MLRSMSTDKIDEIIQFNNVNPSKVNSTLPDFTLRFRDLLSSEFSSNPSKFYSTIVLPCDYESDINTKKMLEDALKNDGKEIELLLFELVKNGKVEEVKNVLTYCNRHFRAFNQWEILYDEDFLKIAIRSHDIKMCHVLLEYQIDIGASLFLAIQEDFLDGVKAIVNCRRNLVQTSYIFSDFGLDVSPFVFAACKNNYQVLSVLYGKYEMPKNNKNPFDYCIDLITSIQNDTRDDKGKKNFYDSLIEKLEDYMCCLLDQIYSTNDLQHVFDWFSNNAEDADNICHELPRKLLRYNPNLYQQLQKHQFRIIERAIQENLKKFVAHQNVQIIFSLMRYHNNPRFLKNSNWNLWIMNRCLMLLYFVWPLLTCFPPWTKIGELVELPAVLFESHLMAELVFLLLLFLNTFTKSAQTDFLGASPTVFEWLIVLFIIGRCVGEAVEMKHRGFSYFKDWWNYFDITLLFLFLLAIILRIPDFIVHSNSQYEIEKHAWPDTDPRLLSSTFLSLAYVLAFLRCLSFSRNSRLLGPMRVSLAKMLINVVQFLVLFLLLLFAFALGLTELYWYFGTPQGAATFCKKSNETGSDCAAALFSSFGISLADLFWTLFGYIEFNVFLNIQDNVFNDYVAVFLVGAYHISVIVVLLNMLIAMMSQSFDETNEDEDTEWKFHRTSMWIRFIRNDISQPPPMNLLPNFYSVYLFIRRSYRKMINGAEYRTFRGDLTDRTKRSQETVKSSKQSVLKLLMKRYKKKYICKKSEEENLFEQNFQKYSSQRCDNKMKLHKENNLEMLIGSL